MPDNPFIETYPYRKCSSCNGNGGCTRIPPELPRNCTRNLDGNCAGCRDLLEIDEKIADTRRVLDELLQEREAKAADINKHHDPFARSLPMELATLILGKSVIDIPFPCYNAYFAQQYVDSLTSLALVCRQWHIILLETPSIWAYIGAAVSEENHIHAVAAVARLLKMSKEQPLHVYLFYSHPSDSSVLQSVFRIFELLGEQADRLQALDMNLPPEAMGELSTYFKNTMPRLDYLHYRLNDYRHRSDASLHLQASPRSLILNKDWGGVNLGLARLIRLEFDYSSITIKGCLSILQAASHLEHFILHEVKRDEGDIDSVDTAIEIATKFPFVHPKLRTLESGLSPPKKFWDSFSFPSLTALRVSAERNETQVPLQNFLVHSGGAIKELKISTEGNWVDLLRSAPRVTKLHLSIHPTSSSAFLLLDEALGLISQVNGGASTLLPEIHFLEITIESVILQARLFSVDWSALIRFLGALRSNRKTLRRVAMKFADHNQRYPTLKSYGSLPTQDEFYQLLRATKGINFTLKDVMGTNIIERLRKEYKK